MTYAYPRSTGASSLPSLAPGKKPPNVLSRAWYRVSPLAKEWITDGNAAYGFGKGRDKNDIQTSPLRILRRVFTVTNAIILLWIFTLWWGERSVFQDSLEACAWEKWEKWPQAATPHHVAFIADPQLVDPHTYPGRPWPLSTLTVKYTDQYLRRSFSSIQKHFAPDSVLFLGDLFDGGREWATNNSTSPEERYKKIKDSFWKKEYKRFVKIFSDQWDRRSLSPADGRGRKMIASLPGNHDLGFGTGVQEPVRDRFETFFGQSNRVDVIGNHTFVSVDTVSLSAMDQPDPLTGSSSKIEGDTKSLIRPIWKDADEFLEQAAVYKAKAESEELRALRNQSEGNIFEYRIVEPLEPSIHRKAQPVSAGFPTILLSHVPLYRKPATPCGPLRERYPPSSPGKELEEDEPNALKISGGYQYQNVLTPTISRELISKAGPNVVQVYSGDDHDYCEISHREFNGSPKEITVKSLSWAMGVRHPGFLLTSLWNPIEPETGRSIQHGSATIQNHLCLLPDQISIFIYYGYILGLSIAVLFIQSIYRVHYASPASSSNSSVLPLSERRPYSRHQYQTSGTSSSTLSPGSLASRGTVGVSPRYHTTKPYHDAYSVPDRNDVNWKGKTALRHPSKVGIRASAALIGQEFYLSVKSVAQVVLAVYFFLIWRW